MVLKVLGSRSDRVLGVYPNSRVMSVLVIVVVVVFVLVFFFLLLLLLIHSTTRHAIHGGGFDLFESYSKRSRLFSSLQDEWDEIKDCTQPNVIC